MPTDSLTTTLALHDGSASTSAAEAIAEAVLGCAVTSRYSSAAAYVVVEG